MTQEYLIVGAGLAGLYSAWSLTKSYPSASITILESDSEAGGRIRTQETPGFRVEKGAARFASSHTRFIGLLSDLGLQDKMTELPKERVFVYRGKTTSYDIYRTLKEVCKKGVSQTRKEISFFQHCVEHLPGGFEEAQKLQAAFGFDAEFERLSCEAFIGMFSDDLAMDQSYYVLAGGLSQVIHGLVSRLSERGVTILYESRVTDIQKDHVSYDIQGKTRRLRGGHVIVTTPYLQLQTFDLFRDEEWVHAIEPIPLHRFYVKYDTCWFQGLPTHTTDSYLRYMIPMSEEECTVMYYTDSLHADEWKQWNEVGTDTIIKRLHQEVKGLVTPERWKRLHKANVKDTKSCYWSGGCHVWKPGVSYKDVARKALQPFPGLHIYVCGEGYSTCQDWMEGAMDSAHQVCRKLGCRGVAKPGTTLHRRVRDLSRRRRSRSRRRHHDH